MVYVNIIKENYKILLSEQYLFILFGPKFLRLTVFALFSFIKYTYKSILYFLLMEKKIDKVCLEKPHLIHLAPYRFCTIIILII